MLELHTAAHSLPLHNWIFCTIIWGKAVIPSDKEQKRLTNAAMSHTSMSTRHISTRVFLGVALKVFQKILKATYICFLVILVKYVLPLVQTLHDKGQVLLLKKDKDISDCWVITNIAAMLETVVGSIFAPRDFPQHIAAGSWNCAKVQNK